MQTKGKFKKGQLVKVNTNYKGKYENTGVVIRYNYTDHIGISYYEVYWMKDIHTLPEIWIERA